MTAQVLAFCNPVAFSEHQGYSKWNETVDFSTAQHHTNFETLRFARVLLTHDDDKHIFHEIPPTVFSPSKIVCAQQQQKMIIKQHELKKAKRLCYRAEFRPNRYLSWQKNEHDRLFICLYNCDLERRSKLSKLVSKC